LGDMSSALRYAEEAVEGPDIDGHVLTQMAGIFASAGQGERAVALLDRAIEIDPTTGEPYFAKGLLLLSLKRTTDSEQAMRAGLVRSPDSAVGHYHLGRVLLESGKIEEAAASFERAIAANPTFEPAYLALTSVYESRHERERAIGVLKRYLQGVNP